MLLPDHLALVYIQFFDLAFDVVDLGELLQCKAGDLAFVGRMQVEEFATACARQPTSVTPLAIRAL